MTIEADLRGWFERGFERGYSHMVVICDTFDYSDFPVYYNNWRDCLERIDNPGDMAKVMEVYDLSMDMQEQLDEHRAFHPPSRFNIPKMDAKVMAEMEEDYDVSAGGFNPLSDPPTDTDSRTTRDPYANLMKWDKIDSLLDEIMINGMSQDSEDQLRGYLSEIRTLDSIRSGEEIVVPVDAFHAKAMVSIGTKYLEDSGHRYNQPENNYWSRGHSMAKRTSEQTVGAACPKHTKGNGPLGYSRRDTYSTPDEHPTPEQTEGMVEPPHDVLQSALRRTGRKVYPPEKTRDALAALERLKERAERAEDPEKGELCSSQEDADEVRRNLTASGVPEEVRRLPDKWAAEVDGAEVESHWRDAVGGCIDDLKDVLASAPAENPHVCPDCRDNSTAHVVGWYYKCWECGQKWKEVEEGEPTMGDVTTKYYELLYAVETKHPGETRHETALRYIINSEKGDNTETGGTNES